MITSSSSAPSVPNPRLSALRRLLSDFALFSRMLYPERALRGYQLEAAMGVLRAVEERRGGAQVVVFSRQAGKDELLAQLQAFLLVRYRSLGGNIVVAAPSFRPQCLVSRRRLWERVQGVLWPDARISDGYRVAAGNAGVSFLSTEARANARGESADRLLIANEAQDITTERWDSVFAPMAASTNSPSLFSGTPWSHTSLLARERQRVASRELRVASKGSTANNSRLTTNNYSYEADWERVAEEVPAYGEHVKQRMAQLGERHPFILTEYCLQELGSDVGLFPQRRQAQMRGTHEREVSYQKSEIRGRRYAMLLDLAGEDEDAPDNLSAWTRERQRDSVALTVVEVDTATVKDDLLRRPTYRVVDRREWVGQRHASLVPSLLDLVRSVWKAGWLVVDASGCGSTVAGVLSAALAGTRTEVIPFVFTGRTKSDLCWSFLGCIESGRYKEYADDGAVDTARFWEQVEKCEYTVLPGPGKTARWGVPQGRGHDDLVVSAALCGVLDERDWRPREVSSRTRSDFV